MNWEKIRKLHPGNWVVVHALDGRTEKGQRIITQFALMDVCGDDWKEAWERYKELHAAHKWKEYYVLHTDREKLNIEVMEAFGRKVMDESNAPSDKPEDWVLRHRLKADKSKNIIC